MDGRIVRCGIINSRLARRLFSAFGQESVSCKKRRTCLYLTGIRQYVAVHEDDAGAGPARARKLTDVRIYHDVSILSPVCSPSGIQHRIRFDATRLGRVRWRYARYCL